MKSKLTLFLILFLSFSTNRIYSNVVPVSTSINEVKAGQQTAGTLKKQSFQQFKKATEKKLGRKLKLKEKISLWYSTHAPGPTEADKAKNKALLGFIFGLVGVLIFAPLAIPGLIFSLKAMNMEKKQPGILDKSSKGMAIAGIILSSIGLLVLVFLFIYVIALVGFVGFGI